MIIVVFIIICLFLYILRFSTNAWPDFHKGGWARIKRFRSLQYTFFSSFFLLSIYPLSGNQLDQLVPNTLSYTCYRWRQIDLKIMNLSFVTHFFLHVCAPLFIKVYSLSLVRNCTPRRLEPQNPPGAHASLCWVSCFSTFLAVLALFSGVSTF